MYRLLSVSFYPSFKIPDSFNGFGGSVLPSEDTFRIKKLQKEITILYRLEKNLFHALSLLRFIDDTLGRVVDILVSIKSLLVDAASAPSDERRVIQHQINEKVRNVFHLLEGFSYDGLNPFKGDKIIVHYGSKPDEYLILNGRTLDRDGSELVIKAELPSDEEGPSRIKLWNRYYWRGVRRYGIALWANDGGNPYKLTLRPSPNYIGIPPRIIFPGDPPFYWPPFVNGLIVIEFTFYTATEEAVQRSIEDAEKAITTFDKIRGFYAAALNKLQNLLEFQQLKRADLREPVDRLELSVLAERLVSSLFWELNQNLSLTLEVQRLVHYGRLLELLKS